MMEVFLMCALAVPSSSHTRPAIVSYHAMTDEEVAERIKRIHDFEEVFIHPNPNEEKLKEHGYEKYPAWINKKHVWIKRKIHHDTPQKRAIGASA